VLKADRTLFAWGENEYGETNIPAGLNNVVAIAAGAGHNLALKADGTVAAWGADNYGQTDVPVGLSNVVAIAAGGWHSLALKRDGTVVAWGAGVGTNAEDYGQNLVPAALSNVIQIAAGTVHSLVLAGAAPPTTQALLSQPQLRPPELSVWLPTQNGRVYQLEFKNSLADRTWTALPLQAGNGRTMRFVDIPASAPQRFYRILRW
jgi:hypothetical protein